MFKSKFVGWNDVIPCDFTRTADSVQRRGADVKVGGGGLPGTSLLFLAQATTALDV